MTMKCGELLRQLAEYEDGVLPDAVCEELRRHLTECEACQGLSEDLEALSRLCRGCEPPRLPDDLRRRLVARLQEPAR
jgi:predicted anti-sigma-YlaC factor YlaD